MTLLRMAASYRHSAELLRLRIADLKDESKTASQQERPSLERRVRDLKVLYRDARSTALKLERYYGGRAQANG